MENNEKNIIFFSCSGKDKIKVDKFINEITNKFEVFYSVCFNNQNEQELLKFKQETNKNLEKAFLFVYFNSVNYYKTPTCNYQYLRALRLKISKNIKVIEINLDNSRDLYVLRRSDIYIEHKSDDISDSLNKFLDYIKKIDGNKEDNNWFRWFQKPFLSSDKLSFKIELVKLHEIKTDWILICISSSNDEENFKANMNVRFISYTVIKYKLNKWVTEKIDDKLFSHMLILDIDRSENKNESEIIEIELNNIDGTKIASVNLFRFFQLGKMENYINIINETEWGVDKIFNELKREIFHKMDSLNTLKEKMDFIGLIGKNVGLNLAIKKIKEKNRVDIKKWDIPKI